MVSEFAELVVPGLFDSGPDHWQSHWCRSRDCCRRVELGQWDCPTPGVWISRIDRAVAREDRPVIFVAHSLGCLAVAGWVAEATQARTGKVVGALLVAPPDVDRAAAHPLIRSFAPTPSTSLPFPSILVASRDDHHADFGRSAWRARTWGSDFVDAGHLGHINVDSDVGAWSEGLALLERLETLRRRPEEFPSGPAAPATDGLRRASR